MNDDAEHTPARPGGRRRKVLVGAAVAAVAFVSTLAFAEWLASGTGEGYAQATTVQALTTESATAAASLYPGGTGDLALRIHNPNPFPVTVTTVAQNGPITSDDADCDAAGHGVTFTTFTGALALDGGETKTFTLNDVLAMSVSSANECPGAVFTVPVSLNGGSTGGGGGGGGDPESCDDGSPLTIDAFDPATQTCTHTPDLAQCDDGNPLTIDTVEFNTCTHTPVPDGTACDDGDPNTGEDQAVGGVCVGMPLHPYYANFDGDLFGDPNVVVWATSRPLGYVEYWDALDCDDSNWMVFPGAEELPDGLDNDCDGIIDEGLSG